MTCDCIVQLREAVRARDKPNPENTRETAGHFERHFIRRHWLLLDSFRFVRRRIRFIDLYSVLCRFFAFLLSDIFVVSEDSRPTTTESHNVYRRGL